MEAKANVPRMAPDPRVSERLYQEIRKRLFAGEFRLRERLDVGALAQLLGASTTPVREALVRLAAERLIASKPTRGFFVWLWSEAELKALYEWRGALLRLAVEQGATNAIVLEGDVEYAERVARLFQLVELRANLELKRAGVNADDRLYAARLAEADLFEDANHELKELCSHLRVGPRRTALQALRRYHTRRAAAARALRDRATLRALGGNGE